MCLFEPSLCNKRWTLSYVRKHQRVFQNNNLESQQQIEKHESSFITDLAVGKPINQRKLNKFEKYKKSMLILRDIASLISEQSGDIFDLSMNNILKLKALLLDGKLIHICELDENNEGNEINLLANFNINHTLEHARVDEIVPSYDNGNSSNNMHEPVVETVDNQIYSDHTEEVFLPNYTDNASYNTDQIDYVSLFNTNTETRTDIFDSEILNSTISQSNNIMTLNTAGKHYFLDNVNKNCNENEGVVFKLTENQNLAEKNKKN